MLVKRNINSKIFYMSKDAEKPVYCLDNIIKSNISSTIICEGPFDCLTAYEFGYSAIATLGQPSIEQINKINKSNIKVLYLGMDNDYSGRAFNSFIKEHLDSRILTVELKWPANKKDLNELTKEEFIKCINKE